MARCAAAPAPPRAAVCLSLALRRHVSFHLHTRAHAARAVDFRFRRRPTRRIDLECPPQALAHRALPRARKHTLRSDGGRRGAAVARGRLPALGLVPAIPPGARLEDAPAVVSAVHLLLRTRRTRAHAIGEASVSARTPGMRGGAPPYAPPGTCACAWWAARATAGRPHITNRISFTCVNWRVLP